MPIFARICVPIAAGHVICVTVLCVRNFQYDSFYRGPSQRFEAFPHSSCPQMPRHVGPERFDGNDSCRCPDPQLHKASRQCESRFDDHIKAVEWKLASFQDQRFPSLLKHGNRCSLPDVRPTVACPPRACSRHATQTKIPDGAADFSVEALPLRFASASADEKLERTTARYL